ncbi:hypothetical protein J470_3570, partial [Acinetobacter baumannii 1032241]
MREKEMVEFTLSCLFFISYSIFSIQKLTELSL